MYTQARKMAEWMKTVAAKPGDPRLTPQTPRGRRKAGMSARAYAHTQSKCEKQNI